MPDEPVTAEDLAEHELMLAEAAADACDGQHLDDLVEEERAARSARQAEYPRAWRRHGAPRSRVDAVKLRFLQRARRAHVARVPGLFDDPVPFRATYSALSRDCWRREATLALIVAVLADDEPEPTFEVEQTEPSPLVSQLVDVLDLAPGAPSSRGVALPAM